MKMSFRSVPEPMLSESNDLFLAAQQMCLALLITGIEVAKEVFPLYGESFDSPENLLRWAENIQKERNNIEWARAIASPVIPLANTHEGFFLGVLQNTKYPGRAQKALFDLVEEIGQDFLRGTWCFPENKIELDENYKINKDAFVTEMVARGCIDLIDESKRIPVSEEVARAFVDKHEVTLYILHMQTLHILNKGEKKKVLEGRDLRYYIARNTITRESLMLRATEERSALGIACAKFNVDKDNVKILELDAESWITLEK